MVTTVWLSEERGSGECISGFFGANAELELT